MVICNSKGGSIGTAARNIGIGTAARNIGTAARNIGKGIGAEDVSRGEGEALFPFPRRIARARGSPAEEAIISDLLDRAEVQVAERLRNLDCDFGGDIAKISALDGLQGSTLFESLLVLAMGDREG